MANHTAFSTDLEYVAGLIEFLVEQRAEEMLAQEKQGYPGQRTTFDAPDSEVSNHLAEGDGGLR